MFSDGHSDSLLGPNIDFVPLLFFFVPRQYSREIPDMIQGFIQSAHFFCERPRRRPVACRATEAAERHQKDPPARSGAGAEKPGRAGLKVDRGETLDGSCLTFHHARTLTISCRFDSRLNGVWSPPTGLSEKVRRSLGITPRAGAGCPRSLAHPAAR